MMSSKRKSNRFGLHLLSLNAIIKSRPICAVTTPLEMNVKLRAISLAINSLSARAHAQEKLHSAIRAYLRHFLPYHPFRLR
uniref:Uncharacterized protein n=1 Tax=Strigamia maritima TaxID=126957 RepID=T1IWH7_STRMM